MWSWLTAPQRALSYTMSSIWSFVTGIERASKPAVSDLLGVAHLCAEISRAYSGDPLRGLLDFSQHPGRVEFHRVRNTLSSLALDCDDVASYAKWLLDGQPWVRWAKVVNVYDAWDVTRANYTHAVCWFELTTGARGIIDTNVIYQDKSFRGAYVGAASPTEYCQTMYGAAGAHFVLYEDAPWPF